MPQQPDRRKVLGAMAVALAGTPGAARAALLHGALPWTPEHTAPPGIVDPTGWTYFTADEASAVEALADRLIPPDPETPGGKDSGCAVYIDRQLAGGYGRDEGHYNAGPYREGYKEQGPQTSTTPADLYRQSLAALDKHCKSAYGGKAFAALTDEQKDKVIAGLENGSIKLGDKPGAFFKQLLKDTQQGFFADPVYGGNKDMVAWKMIGFPGAYYDYRDWIDRHNERVTLPPIGIAHHPDWQE
jgi:gluconate 2-dehydrogenase gamma chain